MYFQVERFRFSMGPLRQSTRSVEATGTRPAHPYLESLIAQLVLHPDDGVFI